MRLGDCRPSGRVRLDAIARYLQDLSADDTADAALPDSQAWVVRRTTIEARVFPRYLEALQLATWCSGTGSHYAARRVAVVGAGGARVDAESLWVHLDLATGRPQRLSESFRERYEEAAAGRQVKARLVHPEPPVDVAFEPWPLRVTDLDVLAHVNNAAYWAVVEEAMARHPHRLGALRAEVEHRRAVEAGATVTWGVEERGPGELSVWIRSDGVVAATARVEVL